MIEINLPDTVNISSAKDKFVDVVNKVIAQPTTVPPTPPPKKDDSDDDEHDEDDEKKQTPKPTEPLIHPITATPPPGGSKGPNPNIPTTTPTKGPIASNAATEANTKVEAKDKGHGSTNTIVISVAVLFCLAVVAIAVFVVRRRQSKMNSRAKALSTPQATTTRNNETMFDDTANYSHMPNTKDLAVQSSSHHSKHLQSSSSMADHPDIQAVRIPIEKIEFASLLSRGGFGEVHRGTYKGQAVAIKRLLPERRKNMREIDAFLSEAKMMGTLEHERIVQFIGVAWDSLVEVCVVSEYMDGGDLRSVLTHWETTERRMHGFDHDKIKIALHVAHAMTYLHSMQPMILHRDLKSKNILLTRDLDAKVTDFGVSRERSDATMTAGVGSSLWMAPEVMMGERYDEKADVFSFGVVLSELDTHLLPYSHATEPGTGRKIPDTAILQMVALGRITVEFTASPDPDMVSLGRDCVALDPKDRPTAGEALHRVHQVWRSCIAL